jgi:hypothetical protein
MKKYDKQRLFEVMEKINPEMDNSWAIFRVSKGYGKCFVTSLSGGDNKLFGTCDYRVKQSDPNVLKFSLEEAKELIRRNIGIDENIGIVNNRGVQKLFDWRIKYPDKYDEKGNEIG